MVEKRIKQILAFALLVLLVVMGMGAGVVLDHAAFVAHAQAGATPTAAATGPDMQLIAQAWNKIEQNYVDPSAEQGNPMTYGAISGMVNALGDTGHSSFLSPQMVKSERDFTQGQFEGIGAEVEDKNGQVVIVAPFDGSPAQKAGLRAGDAIIKVDGGDVSGLPLDQVIGRILGPAGTSVTLTIQEPATGQTRDVPLVRAQITMNNVTWQVLPGTQIAHVRIAGFSQGVSQELKQALTQMKGQGVTGVILDLRNNPGGLLQEAVNTTSQFLASGDVLLEKDAQGNVTHDAVRPGGAATQIPLVVLVNNGTASAAEIVAGAIQDAGRAKLIGETTFGTGTVLNEFSLSDGSALMLAVEEWLTPSGRVIWHKGIAPDQTVSLAADAITLTPESERSMTAAQLQKSGDQQLTQALHSFEHTANRAAPWATAGRTSLEPAPAEPPAPAAATALALAFNLQVLQRFALI